MYTQLFPLRRVPEALGGHKKAWLKMLTAIREKKAKNKDKYT